ncbi:MAG TPA: MFS transporter [Solirubrobacteraceae bacterium]|nr:MFS transporter [Solirubrobacteraceae bacterium]
MPILGHVRAGARRYRELLAIPGARGPVIASVAGSMPIGMYTFGIVLLVRDATGSFAAAGRIAGAFGLANALGAVLQGRLMDRLGQRRVLRAVAAAHLIAVAGLVLAATERAPAWLLMLCALAGGGSLPQVPAAMRSLWSALVEDEQRRQTAYALVTIVFEVSVVTAPVLVAALSALASPAVAMLAAVGLATAGALGFAGTPASRGWRGALHPVGWLGPLAAAGVRTLFAVLAGFGTAIGVLQVAMPAFAAGRWSAEAGGYFLAALSAGSLCGGLVYGARSWPGAPAARVAGLVLGVGAGCALVAAADTTVPMALAMVALGFLLAPTVTACSALLDVVAPPGTMTEAFAVLVMGIVAGTAAGNALGGALVEAGSYRAAALAAAAVAALGAAVALALRRTLSPRAA